MACYFVFFRSLDFDSILAYIKEEYLYRCNGLFEGSLIIILALSGPLHANQIIAASINISTISESHSIKISTHRWIIWYQV